MPTGESAVKVRRRLKRHWLAREGMVERQFGSVQANPRAGCASIQHVPENGEPLFRRMNANLVGAAGVRLRLDGPRNRAPAEACFGNLASVRGDG